MADSASESAAELSKKARDLGSAMGQFSSSASSAAGQAGDLASSFSQIAGGAVNFTKQITTGTDTFGKFSGSINQMTDGAGDLIMAIGKGSAISVGFGMLAKALGAVVGKVLENNDSISSSYDKIASFGGAVGYTTLSLEKAGDSAGYPVSNGMFKVLTENMSKISTDLTGLASTTSGGVAKFIEISKVGPDVLDQFNKLGVSQDKLNQYQAAYVSQQVKTGAARKMNEDQLRAGSIEYAKNLVELAAVTGKSTDQIKESQKTDLDDVSYMIHVRKLQQTEEGRKQYLREQKIAEETERIYGKEGRKAFLKVAATGTIVGEQASAMATGLAIGGKDYVSTVKQAIKGQIDTEQYGKTLQDGQAKQLDRLGNAVNLQDDNSRASMMITTDSLKGQSQIIEEGTAKKVRSDINNAKDRKDDIKETQNELRNLNKDVATAFDEFVGLISGAVHNVFRGLMYGLSSLTKGIMEFLKDPRVQKATGLKIDQSVSAMFMSTEELTKRNNEITERMKEVEKVNKDGLWGKIKNEVSNPFNAVRPGEKKDLIEEQKAIQEALAIRKRTESNSTAPNAGKPPTASSATTSTAPAPPGPQASGAAPPPTATPGSHADGGVARPPFSGFSGALGGTEATIPLPSGENIPAKIKMPTDLTTNRDSLLGSSNTVQGLLSQYTSNLGGSTTATAPAGPTGKSNTNIFELVASRMDDLIEKMNKNNNIQTELLQLSKR